MYYCLTAREQLIACLPTQATIAEIGVAYGDFAWHMLHSVQPRALHLIDPWSHLETLAQDPAILYQATLDDAAQPVPENEGGAAIYQQVLQRFVAYPQVTAHRQFSYKLAPRFADGYFDCLYIDGNHLYEFVLSDLTLYAAKLKDDGLIFGHDFFEDGFAAEHRYGVIDAVNRFLKRSDFQLLALTSEPFSTYVLARRTSGFAAQFLQNCFAADFQIVELPAEIAFNYHDRQVALADGSRRIPSFKRRGGA